MEKQHLHGGRLTGDLGRGEPRYPLARTPLLRVSLAIVEGNLRLPASSSNEGSTTQRIIDVGRGESELREGGCTSR